MSKYLEWNDTNKSITEVQPINQSTGVSDAGKIIETDASGLIDPSFLPDSDSKVFTTSEALAAGDLVNIHDSSGPKVRKADASLGVSGRAMGYVKTSATSGGTVTVYRDGVNIPSGGGMTIGAKQFLSGTTPGARTETPPSASGHSSKKLPS